LIFESAELEREVDPPGCQYFELFVSGDLSSCFFQIFGSDEFRFSLAMKVNPHFGNTSPIRPKGERFEIE